MCSGAGSGALPPLGLPIRTSAGQRVCAPHRGLSQLATSFFGFLCQGIHRAPLVSSRLKFKFRIAYEQIVIIRDRSKNQFSLLRYAAVKVPAVRGPWVPETAYARGGRFAIDLGGGIVSP